MIRENKLYDELSIGDTESVKRVCTANDLYVFAHASGNLNPLHIPDDDDHDDHEAVAPSMWVGALISSVLGNVLPGPGTLYRSQSLRFLDRAHVATSLRSPLKTSSRTPVVVMETVVTGRGGETVAEGIAEVLAPERKVRVDMEELPEIVLQRHQHFDHYIHSCEGLEPLVTAVVAPEEKESLGGALLAARHSLIRPILIGSEPLIRQAAHDAGEDIGMYEIIDIPDHVAAAGRAVELVHEGYAGAIMKGHLHTSDLLHEVLKSKGGLRTSRRMSHAFVMDVPGLDHPLIISDAAINITPDLATKVDITQSAIDVALALGIQKPKVGVLSAVETVNPQIPSTLDAAALSKMSDRGQIKGGVVDGPLAMDNAMDAEAATTKGVTGLVAGHAEVLIVPNLEAGNMLAKQLAFVSGAEAAGIALGASVPIILTSRADGEKGRLASCAIAVLYRFWQENGVPVGSRLAEAAE
ncbi:enoyl-CoA hydratase [Methyloceanibacter stevinii]|uniref:Enoyl-CoA hydratase n=1 Tax=Methyloceanibacter stevinii TaxID=1774970 RepID=A0A1E3VQH5_9HYPH|nr:bifunctional enoyl-CoA hydratase/phosphate acetyltransferase [Methyloceanibacter stevinii]ODR95773.1 enoyl-CoA hydratase [Methyloceanibacter stevinii]